MVWHGRERGPSQVGATWRKRGGPDVMWREDEGEVVRAEEVGVRPTAVPGRGGARSSGAWMEFGQGRQGPITRGPHQQYWVLNRFKPSQSIQTRLNLF
jgi:hypothetical protein